MQNWPIGSIYGILTCIYLKNQPFLQVYKYTVRPVDPCWWCKKTNWPPKRQWVWLPVMSGWSRPSHSWDLGSRPHVFFGLFLGRESCRNYWNLQDFICIGKIFFVYNYMHIFEKTICNSHHIHAVELTITLKTLFPSCGSNWDFISLVASTYKVWWCLVFSGPRSTPPTTLTIQFSCSAILGWKFFTWKTWSFPSSMVFHCISNSLPPLAE